MEYERFDLMEPYELQMYQMTEQRKKQILSECMEKFTEEERVFCEEVNEKLNKYAWNIFEQNKLNSNIYKITSEAEWKKFFASRAVRLRELYEENEEIVKFIKEALERPLSSDLGSFWRDEVIVHFQNRMIEDTHVVLPILDKVIEFFEGNGDYKVLPSACYLRQIMLCSTIVGMGTGGKERLSYGYKTIALKDYIAECDYPSMVIHSYVVVIYYGLKDKLVPVDETYRLLKELIEFWKTEPLKNNSPQARMQAEFSFETAKINWLSYIDDVIDEQSDEVKSFFCALSDEMGEKMKPEGSPLRQLEHMIVATGIHARVLRGEISYDDALKELLAYYVEHKNALKDSNTIDKSMDNESDDRHVTASYFGVANNYEVLSFMLETVIFLERWTHKCSDKELVDSVMSLLVVDIPEFYHYFTNLPLEVSQQLADLCFAIMPYVEGQENKERWVFELVTKKQFATHLHSLMVQKEVDAVAKGLYAARPELFDKVKKQIGDRPLLDFISKSALLHDIGKNDIATIVNVQARALDDDEFFAIRQHPTLGYGRVFNDPDFDCYRDAVQYHHKSYDGKNGYPAGLDIAASPYKIVVDLITICDCMDAATDTLGRNYKKPKTLDDVLAEFKNGAGTRYNPEIVKFIEESDTIKDELRRIITDSRIDTAYRIATEY